MNSNAGVSRNLVIKKCIRLIPNPNFRKLCRKIILNQVRDTGCCLTINKKVLCNAFYFFLNLPHCMLSGHIFDVFPLYNIA